MMSTAEYSFSPSDDELWTLNVTTYVTNGSTTPSPTVVPSSYYLLIRDIYFVLNGIVVCAGLLFNSIALAVFATSAALRHTTTGHYLIALSLADSTYLFADLFRWLASNSHSYTAYTEPVDLLNKYDVACRLVNTVRYTAMLCSSSITVAITTERFLTIRCPLNVGQISTPRIAKIVIGLIAVVSAAFCIFPLWCLKIYPSPTIEVRLCQIDMAKIDIFKTMIWVSIRVMSLIVPSVIVTVLTIWIIALLRERDREQYALQAHATPGDRHNVLERQLTVMLVAVDIAFVVLRLPYTIIWDINQFKSSIWPSLDPWLSYQIYVAYKLTDVLAITNYAINFFLYFLCGSTFRKQLLKLFHCEGNRPRRQRTWNTVSSFISRRSSSMVDSQINPRQNGQPQRPLSQSFEMSNHRSSSRKANPRSCKESMT